MKAILTTLILLTACGTEESQLSSEESTYTLTTSRIFVLCSDGTMTTLDPVTEDVTVTYTISKLTMTGEHHTYEGHYSQDGFEVDMVLEDSDQFGKYTFSRSFSGSFAEGGSTYFYKIYEGGSYCSYSGTWTAEEVIQ